MEYTYSLPAVHCSELLECLNEQRKLENENLCDVRFTVGNDCVYAHRCVLAVCSAYFQGLLSGAFLESQGDGGTCSKMMELDFTGSISNIAHLDTLLTAAYTGSLKLSTDNITGVTELACFLLVERVRVVCESFLLENLSLDNCIPYLKLAWRYDLPPLFKACSKLLQGRFHDHFIYLPLMLTIPGPCLKLLTKAYRHVRLQDVVQFLINWIDGQGEHGDLNNTKEEKLAVACEILSLHCQHLNIEPFNQVVQEELNGCEDQIISLLQHCSIWIAHPGMSPNLKDESKNTAYSCASAGERNVDPRQQNSREDVRFFTGCWSCRKLRNVRVLSQNVSKCKLERVNENKTPLDGDADCFETKTKSMNLHENFNTSAFMKQSKTENCLHFTPENSNTRDGNRLCKLKLENDSLGNGTKNYECGVDDKELLTDIGSCSGKLNRADVMANDSEKELEDKQMKIISSTHCGKDFKRKRQTDTDRHESDIRKKSRHPDYQVASSSSMTDLNSEAVNLPTQDVLVAFAPARSAVSYFAATDCARNRPTFIVLHLHVCLYDIVKKRWLQLGDVVFPGKFEEKDCWRVVCVKCKAYFFSLPRQVLHVLDLHKMSWQQLDCRPLFCSLKGNTRVRSLAPMSVDGSLYVLVSDKQAQGNINEDILTHQRFFLLMQDNSWRPVADLEHTHSATPLTLFTVDDKKVFVVKANIALNLDKSMLIVREGYIFDTVKEKVSQFQASTFAATPTRVLVGDGSVHIVDGDSNHQQLSEVGPGTHRWIDRGEVNLSDIKIARAASGESFYPCLTHGSANVGASCWEFSSLQEHCTALTELKLDSDGQVFTVRHTPPPFRYVTYMTTSRLSSELVASAVPCHYLHVDNLN